MAIALVAVCCNAGLAAPAGAKPPSTATPSASEKTYTLFMGADFSINDGKAVRRVVDVDGGSFVVDVAGDPKLVPMNQGAINVKIDQTLKLTDRFATIAELKAERAYTPMQNPRQRYAMQLAAALAESAAAGNSEQRRNTPSENPDAASAGPKNQNGSTAWSSTSGEFESRSTPGPDLTGFGGSTSSFYDRKINEELALELFDAMDVSFLVSSPTPLNHPYIVVVAQYQEKGAPTTSRNWIYARAIDPVSETPQKVKFNQGGFKPGFTLEKFTVHLYHGGREIASNIADRRVPLTIDEAHQYAVAQHLTQNRGKNARAMLALGAPRETAFAVTGVPPTRRTLYVKVAKDGRAGAIFTDETCTAPIEAALQSALLEKLRFLPAMDNGKAADGVATIEL